MHRWRALVCNLSFLVDSIASVARVKGLHTRQAEYVSNTVRLDLLVQGRVAAKDRREVHLKEPGLQLLVDEDVEAEQLEAVGALGRAEHICGVIDNMLHTDDRLDDAVFDLLEQQHVVEAHQLQALAQRIDGPLRTLVVLRRICVVLEVGIVLIQAVVR